MGEADGVGKLMDGDVLAKLLLQKGDAEGIGDHAVAAARAPSPPRRGNPNRPVAKAVFFGDPFGQGGHLFEGEFFKKRRFAPRKRRDSSPKRRRARG